MITKDSFLRALSCTKLYISPFYKKIVSWRICLKTHSATFFCGNSLPNITLCIHLLTILLIFRCLAIRFRGFFPWRLYYERKWCAWVDSLGSKSRGGWSIFISTRRPWRSPPGLKSGLSPPLIFSVIKKNQICYSTRF